MDQSISAWIQPAIIVAAILFATRITTNAINKRLDDFRMHLDKRIDDLRSQMSREHDTLAVKVDTLTRTATEHISNHEIHKV